ncbi:sensor domain-containing diguanylate cyclase [Bacillus dakarensis]|uniref:sensor domain-containing diguanylate cyclase n=1 Tax=Robertmurraya dakarensis TaxID=1926278 RepID=UPI0009819229|nr:sensor domain-containing diguanylate cyclase [Bacillus dakarensis]
MFIKKGIKLKFAISLLVIFTVGSTTIINLYLSTHALRVNLTENHLENNFRYATKISISTNDLLNNMQQNLSTLATIIGNKEFTQSDLDDWKSGSSGYYNSLFTTDENGVVQLISPQALPSNQGSVKPGTKITTNLMKQALNNKEPFISDPYLAQTGNLVVLISHPIFDQHGNYKGVVDGTIYLESNNSLREILNSHELKSQSSVIVVDRLGSIIYHPDPSRINESIADHPLVQNVMGGKNGAAQIINSRGIEYFSGYAYVEETGWGIIAQTPTAVMEEPLHNLTKDMIIRSLPLLLIILLLSGLFANHLSQPITRLARFSEKAIQNNQQNTSIEKLDIKSSIYEVRQLYQHILEHFQLLNKQISYDGLTGLANRRAFDTQMNYLIKQKMSFSLLMLDIDHFKKVNDVYGHLVGDDVLRFLALLMKEASRGEDLCYRYGGEEFAFLLKGKNLDDAIAMAERLRNKVAETPSPTGKPIHISIGISCYQNEDQLPEVIIKRADSALYHSKNTGRNKTTVFEYMKEDLKELS